MKGSLIIIALFVAGLWCGHAQCLPPLVANGEWSFYALCLLMGCVGFGIGHNPDIWKSFRRLSPRLILLPVGTIVGTLSACALLGWMWPHRTAIDTMAVGAGLGYYSLSSIFITEYKGAELGTIALVSNIVRELLTLLCAPLLAYFFGKLAPISAGGATTADTTLPVILRYCGQEFALLAIFHGIVVDLSVPFLVTLLCTLPL